MISANIFQLYSKYPYWRVDFSIMNEQNIQIGLNSSFFKVIQPPSGGFCTVDNLNGTSLSTFFNIFCSNWTYFCLLKHIG